MKLRRRAVCALMAVLLALLPAGCREKGVQVVDGAGETVNLRFLGFKVGADKVEEIDGILNRYMEQNEDVVIVYEGLGDNFVDILTNRLENGYADDLFMISDQALTTYETRGWYGTLIADLSGEKFVQRYNPIIQQLITVDGKISAVPMCLSVVGMLGNMDVLRACGIGEMPRTFDEWVRDMEIVRDHGYTPMVNYQGNAASISFLMSGRSAAPFIEGARTVSEGLTAEEVYAGGIRDVYALVENGLIDREQMSGETDARSYRKVLGEQFAGGGVAFAVAPSWSLSAFLAGEPGFQYRYAGLPVGDEGPLTCVRASVLVGVNNEGPHREEALRFLDFLMQPEHIESYAAEQNSLSPLQGAQSGDPLFAEQLALIGEDRIYSDTDSRIPFNLLKLLNGAAAQMVRGDPLDRILADFSAGVLAGRRPK